MSQYSHETTTIRQRWWSRRREIVRISPVLDDTGVCCLQVESPSTVFHCVALDSPRKPFLNFPLWSPSQRSDMRSGDLSGAAPTGPRGRRVSWVWQLLLTQLLLTVRTAATLPLTGESSSSSSSSDDDDNDEICTFLSVLRVTVRLRAPPTASRHKVCCVKTKKPQKKKTIRPYSTHTLSSSYWTIIKSMSW